MSQEPTDISLDSLLRTLEQHYGSQAAWLFRANGIPEPPRLPDPALREPPANVGAPPREPDPTITELSDGT